MTTSNIHQNLRNILMVCLIVALVIPFVSFGKNANAASASIPVGVQIKDTSGDLIQAHGAGMIEAGGYYYMFGENRNPDWSFKAVSMYRSTDFKNWEFVNDVLTSSSHADLNFVNIERPKIIYNDSTGKYVLWAHKENGVDYGDAEVAVASSDTVDGDYTYHGTFRPLGYDSRDMTIYNDNGTAYLFSSTRVNADMNIYKLTPDFLGIDSLVQTLWEGQYREAPAVFKRNGVYFLVTSGATGWDPNQGKYATAASIEGNWTNPTNFGNAVTYDSQPTYVIPIEGSQTTSYIYMGDRWAGAWGGPVNDSRYMWLPLEFPSDTSLTMNYADNISVDTFTGEVSGFNHALNSAEDYELINHNSGKTLSVGGTDKTVDGAPIQQYTDTEAAYQRWKISNKGNGYYSITSSESGKYMDISSASQSDGAHNIQWSANGGLNQDWQIIDSENGYYRIENRNSRKVLDIENSSLSDGAQNVQWTPNWTTSQEFQITVEASEPDTEDPTTPTNLSATAVSGSQIDLSWTASTDNVGVAGYKIYRDSVEIDTTSSTTYNDSGLAAATSYNYTVQAYDAANNLSSESISDSATTAAVSSTMHVEDITMAIQSGQGQTWATAEILIHDGDGNPVDNASVSGQWSGNTTDSDSMVTGLDGKVTINSDQVKNPAKGTYTFTVNNVTHSTLTYDSSENVISSNSITK